MGLTADPNQSGGDPADAVWLQESRDVFPESVRTVAVRWEQGLRGLIGLVSVSGLVAAPLAGPHLSGPTPAIVGVALAVTLLTAGTGLVLAMSAAYGSIGLVDPPATRSGRRQFYRRQAERDRRRLVWGRRLAVSAVALFALTVALVWFDLSPRPDPQLLVRTREGAVLCGQPIPAAAGVLALRVDAGRANTIPTAAIVALDAVTDCPDAPS
jgi:hypothetical protein